MYSRWNVEISFPTQICYIQDSCLKATIFHRFPIEYQSLYIITTYLCVLHGSVPLLCILRDISLQRLTDTGVTWFGYKQLHFNILDPGDTYTIWIVNSSTVCDMGLLPDTKIAGCACAENAGNVFPDTEFKGNRWLAIPTCITARAWRTCLDACRDH